MQVLAVTSKSLINSKWINLGIKTFSPREFLCLLIGLISIIAALTGKSHPGLAVFGFLIIIFGFVPFGFLSTEKKIMVFLAFHLKKDNSTKRAKKESSYHTGYGDSGTEDILEESLDIKKISDSEIVLLEDLDIPHVLKLKTTAKDQFIPVTVYFSDGTKEIPISHTTTERRGRVSCTVLLEQYGQRRVRVVSDKSEIFYDKMVEFTQK